MLHLTVTLSVFELKKSVSALLPKAPTQRQIVNVSMGGIFQGYLCAPKSYIATQAPMNHTREDFWQLAWEQQAQVILMLTGLEENGIVSYL